MSSIRPVNLGAQFTVLYLDLSDVTADICWRRRNDPIISFASPVVLRWTVYGLILHVATAACRDPCD